MNTARTAGYPLLMENHLSDFKRTAVFDWLANNADRKVGHCLEDTEGRLWLIDHGLTFNTEPKLRTVIWDFAGQRVPDELLTDLESLSPRLSKVLLVKLWDSCFHLVRFRPSGSGLS